jgi:predicted nucleic acid-binding protein
LRAVLVDSNILIEVSRGRDAEIITRWEDLGQSDAATLCSPVTVAEIWHGARPSEYKIIQALFDALICIPIDKEIGERAGRYLRQYARSHAVELGDALIAATASIHKVELWTHKRRHYPMKDLFFHS